jgi:LmbE family N-acetylglucosaminyl deacetylase
MKAFTERLWRERIAHFDDCPLPAELPIGAGERALVFAPHPDDEVLGVGGTLARLRRAGCPVRVAVVTDGAAGDPHRYAGGEVVRVRAEETRAALATVEVEDVVFLNEPDGAFRGSAAFARRAGALLVEFRPSWLFLPSPLDYHRDHAAIALALLACWERAGRPGRAFFYEIWSPLPATCIVDIGDVLELKRQALACYRLPLRYRDYIAPCLGLAAYRGLYLPSSGTPRHAEAFTEVGRGGAWRGIWRQLLRLRATLEPQLGRHRTTP